MKKNLSLQIPISIFPDRGVSADKVTHIPIDIIGANLLTGTVDAVCTPLLTPQEYQQTPELLDSLMLTTYGHEWLIGKLHMQYLPARIKALCTLPTHLLLAMLDAYKKDMVDIGPASKWSSDQTIYCKFIYDIMQEIITIRIANAGDYHRLGQQQPYADLLLPISLHMMALITTLDDIRAPWQYNHKNEPVFISINFQHQYRNKKSDYGEIVSSDMEDPLAIAAATDYLTGMLLGSYGMWCKEDSITTNKSIYAAINNLCCVKNPKSAGALQVLETIGERYLDMAEWLKMQGKQHGYERFLEFAIDCFRHCPKIVTAAKQKAEQHNINL